jgi:hypothetical protein
MIIDLEKAFESYIADWRHYIVSYGIDNVAFSDISKIEYDYHFEIVNGAFRHEVMRHNFTYFRKLEKCELKKFIFRSLSDPRSNWEFNLKRKKFCKQLIVY